ncbi:hypothetical protein RFI_20935 [Reticulomyxa filosa]|uniref:SUN domain-containing protein n=1 Tax=Reticulomyxa filosa TaxID=46433 RepID=X6MR07_RETFI|nr:hypothetical protein RFI_20935 [Reticulomyxa filosa]|eukprot:ETO16408.1 hypothetical protein RFI_20935 [Reticulomyxa filosa]
MPDILEKLQSLLKKTDQTNGDGDKTFKEDPFQETEVGQSEITFQGKQVQLMERIKELERQHKQMIESWQKITTDIRQIETRVEENSNAHHDANASGHQSQTTDTSQELASHALLNRLSTIENTLSIMESNLNAIKATQFISKLSSQDDRPSSQTLPALQQIDWTGDVVHHSTLMSSSYLQSAINWLSQIIGGTYNQQVVKSVTRTGDCLPLKGDNGFFVVKLVQPIFVTQITLEHVDYRLNPYPKSAPKEFTLSV